MKGKCAPRVFLGHVSAKKPCIPAKEPYFLQKNPIFPSSSRNNIGQGAPWIFLAHISAKEACIPAKEPYISAKEPYISVIESKEHWTMRTVDFPRSYFRKRALYF